MDEMTREDEPELHGERRMTEPKGDVQARDQAGEAPQEEPQRPMTIAEAARKGGNTTKKRYGPDFYSRIGRKGGQRVARERGPEFYSEIGRKGGEARVAQSRRLEHESGSEDAQG